MRLVVLLTLGMFLTTPVLAQNAAEFAADHMIFQTTPGAKYKGLILKAKILFAKDRAQPSLVKELLQTAIDLNASDPEAYLVLSDVHVSQWDFNQAKLVLADGLSVTTNGERLKNKMQEINELSKKSRSRSKHTRNEDKV